MSQVLVSPGRVVSLGEDGRLSRGCSLVTQRFSLRILRGQNVDVGIGTRSGSLYELVFGMRGSGCRSVPS